MGAEQRRKAKFQEELDQKKAATIALVKKQKEEEEDSKESKHTAADDVDDIHEYETMEKKEAPWMERHKLKVMQKRQAAKEAKEKADKEWQIAEQRRKAKFQEELDQKKAATIALVKKQK